MRLGAQPGRGDTAGGCTGRAEVGPGPGRPLGAGGRGRRALDAPGRSPRPARESGPWSGRGRRSDHVRPRELARGGGVLCARAHRGWGLGIPRLPSLGLNFPPRARQPPRDDPRVCSSSKLQRGRRGGGKGCAESGEPAGPCRSAAAQPPPPAAPRAAPQLTCGRGRWPRGLEVKEDPRPGLATAEGSSASVNCQNGVEGAEPGRDGSAHLRLTSGGTKAGLQAAGTVRPGPHFRLCLSPSRPPLGRALFFPPGQGGH